MPTASQALVALAVDCVDRGRAAGRRSRRFESRKCDDEILPSRHEHPLSACTPDLPKRTRGGTASRTSKRVNSSLVMVGARKLPWP